MEAARTLSQQRYVTICLFVYTIVFMYSLWMPLLFALLVYCMLALLPQLLVYCIV